MKIKVQVKKDTNEMIFKYFIIIIILVFLFKILPINTLFFLLTKILTIFLLGLFILKLVLFKFTMNKMKAKAISNGYRWSIQAALQTQDPEGIIYILENTLEQLSKFGINFLPERSSYSYPQDESSPSISDVRGFPNRANLREAINMARSLSAEWSHFNAVEKIRAMGEIRAKIQSEDMWLDWESIKLTFEQSKQDVYWFDYDAKEIAESYLNLKDYERAIENYNIAIQIHPHNSLLYCDRGNAYFYLKEYNKAIADYTQAIQINPNYGLAYSNRGLAYLNLKEYHKSIADYTQAIQINPNNDYAFNAYCNRGNAYRTLKEYHKAIADYTQAIRINSNDDHTYESVYFSRGLAYFLLKEYNRAIADYNKVIQANPNDAVAYNNLGLTYYECDNIDQVIQLFQNAIDINVRTNYKIESLLETKLALAVALYSKGKQQESIKLAEYVLQSDRRFADAKFLEEERGWKEKLIADTQILIAQLSNNSQNYSSYPNKLHEDDELNNKSNIQNFLTFQEWLNQNPALQYFSEEEQRKAYQRYLRERQDY
ncbi:hypothetical protein NIES2100_77450 [Calothrix sp. NIES-2100]|uniref:tetratricopeptide repeat protein n=1 Tax=Calothrix sp. NIES-2100 TaxID=1954172 RepID=UPI000B5F74E0|nr:hypothetical protein NIES2100_77450 [Calothrix sp. NIES-2100]